MTLAEWQRIHNAESVQFTTKRGAMGLVLSRPDPSLWHLTDYRVTTRSASVVWLERRTFGEMSR